MSSTWIALLRGVNVGGHKKLPMAEFRTLLKSLGCRDIASYIQSGNAVFGAEGGADDIAAAIEAAVTARFGFHADTFVMPAAHLAKALAVNPFPQAITDPKSLHLIFLAQSAQTLDHRPMRALLRAGQSFELGDGVFYLFSPDGISKCPLADRLPRFINGSMTARNLRTCEKILELAEMAR